jgi:sugar phosphate isomerase/epimerase
LWLPAPLLRQITDERMTQAVRDLLDHLGLSVLGFNGFPMLDFHQPVVKHAVYQPDWTTQARYEYTLQLARLLADLLPAGGSGSISTLPLGWPPPGSETAGFDQQAAAARLTDLVHELARLELDTGRFIHVDLEPEPGCVLSTRDDVLGFFDQHLLGTADDASVRAYLRVCHDVCHAAVVGESPADNLAAYADAGLQIGRVQLSSAPTLELRPTTDPADTHAQLDALGAFTEPRYLHQTSHTSPADKLTLHDDLPDALAAHRDDPAGRWTVHFHVPIHLPRIGPVATTQPGIVETLQNLPPQDTPPAIEVETYAWPVLPEPLQPATLADGIADELRWTRAAASKI